MPSIVVKDSTDVKSRKPYPNEHSARIKSPDAFQANSFRSKEISSGIRIILGKLKGETTMSAQAYRFDKSKFTAEEAKAWLKSHDIKYISFEAASGKSITLCRANSGEITVTRKSDDTWVLEVLGAPYGGHLEGRDEQGEYFSEKTDFVLNEGEERPVFYYHGDTPEGQRERRPEVIGKAKVSRRDEHGLWFEVVLNKVSKYAKRIWDAAIQGIARASTGAIGHLVRKAPNGELLVWPVGELSLLDAADDRQPANQFAVVNLKAAFDQAELSMPEMFVEAEEVETDMVLDEEVCLDDPCAECAAVATVILEAAKNLK